MRTLVHERIALTLLVAALAIAAGSCARSAQSPEDAIPEDPRLLDELGDAHFPISTASPLAQRFFDQGLALSYGFNHEAAVRAFEAAERHDPSCAMCAWGSGLALGPNINAPMGPDAGRAAHAASQRALERADGASPMERALIEALATRYAAEPPDDRAALDLAYANAMREVHARFPEDLDVATLFAESLMDLYPWDYWTDDAEPREYTQEILALLEMVIAKNPDHLGANHYLIHATEEFFPERAEKAADRLGGLAPDAGHLVHMPSHIYWRVGRYQDALEINQRAAAADEQFFAWCRPGAFYRAAYYPHNVHFLWAAASTEGRSDIALTAARKLEAVTRDDVDTFPFLEEFMSIPMLTLARFGRWDELIGTPRPDENLHYLTGIWYYTRGLAGLRIDDPKDAEKKLRKLRRVAARPETQALIVAGGTASAATLLGIAEAHLEGELAAARGDDEAAIAALERAVAAQDALLYMEPPPWYFPTRQALGAVLLDAGRAKDAEAVYRVDLEQYPGNGWSLYGLARSLEAQDRGADAQWAEQGFRNAWARSDVKLQASRF